MAFIFCIVLKKAPIIGDQKGATEKSNADVTADQVDGSRRQRVRSGALCHTGTCARSRQLRAWPFDANVTLLASGDRCDARAVEGGGEPVGGIKSRVSVLGHVRGVARRAARGRGVRRRAAREKWKAGKREPTRREESGSTTKSLNRFAPPSATEHGPSVAAAAAAAIAVPPSVHACPTLSLSFSLPRFFLLSLSPSFSFPLSSPFSFSPSLCASISVFLSFSLSLSLSLPRPPVSPAVSVFPWFAMPLRAATFSRAIREWQLPVANAVRACLSRRLDTADTGCAWVTVYVRACVRARVRSCVRARTVTSEPRAVLVSRPRGGVFIIWYTRRKCARHPPGNLGTARGWRLPRSPDRRCCHNRCCRSLRFDLWVRSWWGT